MAAFGDPRPKRKPPAKFRTQLDQLDRSWTPEKGVGYAHVANLLAAFARKKQA